MVKTISEIFRDEGYRLKRNRARFKFLVADWGAERIAREVRARLNFAIDPHSEFPELEDQETDHLGIHAKTAGSFRVGINFPGGRIRSGKLEVVAGLAAKYSAPGLDSIRRTNKQNLLLVNIPEGNLADIKAELDVHELTYESSNFRKGCVSCTGIEFCTLAVAETKNPMISLVNQLEAESSWYNGKIRIHFSGCPSSCGQHQIADIGFRGARTKGQWRDGRC